MRAFIFPVSIVLSFIFFLSCGTESTPIYTLSTSVVGSGTITPSGGTFEDGEMVTLTSSPNNGWLFDNWSGDGSGTTNTITITMDRDKNVVGYFQRREYPLIISIEGEGTVGERIVSQSKATDYSFETVIELTPNPERGWRFVEWGGDLSGSEVPVQITISEEKNLTVKFSPIVYLGVNGITIMCPEGNIGDIGVVDGVEYEVVDRELLIQRRDEGSDLSKVCVSLVTDMSNLFRNRTFNQSIENWDVSNVTNMSGMFQGSQFNQPIDEWNVSNVTNMSNMFSQSKFNQHIGNWDVSNVTNMSVMFSQSQFNQPIGDWNVSNTTNMRDMFSFSDFDQPIGSWDVSKVTNMLWMFWESQFNQPIENWDVSNVTNMNFLFFRSNFNQSIGKWDVSNVTEMKWMFRDSQFNQNISNWCVRRIKTEPELFSTGSPLIPQYKPVWGTCPD